MIKHSKGVVAYFRNHLNPNLSQWKEGSHDFYLWLQVNRGVAPIGSKHKSKSLFQKMAGDIVEVQTLRGIILLGGDFNVRTTTLLDTIKTSNLCELLQALELTEIEQPGIVAKQ
jgi:hypothetical protein